MKLLPLNACLAELVISCGGQPGVAGEGARSEGCPIVVKVVDYSIAYFGGYERWHDYFHLS